MTQIQAHTDKEFVVLARNTELIRTAAVTRAYRAVSNTSEVMEYFTRVSTTNAAMYTMLYRVFEMSLPGIIYMPYLEKFLATYAVYAETKAVEKRAAKEQVKNDEPKSGQSKPSKTRSHTAFIQSNSSLNSGIADFVRRNEASFIDRRIMNDDDLIPAAPPPIGPDARASAALQWQQDLDSLLNNARANGEEEE